MLTLLPRGEVASGAVEPLETCSARAFMLSLEPCVAALRRNSLNIACVLSAAYAFFRQAKDIQLRLQMPAILRRETCSSVTVSMRKRQISKSKVIELFFIVTLLSGLQSISEGWKWESPTLTHGSIVIRSIQDSLQSFTIKFLKSSIIAKQKWGVEVRRSLVPRPWLYECLRDEDTSRVECIFCPHWKEDSVIIVWCLLPFSVNSKCCTFSCTLLWIARISCRK